MTTKYTIKNKYGEYTITSKDKLEEKLLQKITEIADDIKYKQTLLETIGVIKVVEENYDGEGNQMVLYKRRNTQ